MANSRIVPLSPDVVAQIKSSSVITSMNDVLRGLIQNSLDSGASKINVSVDFARGVCVVEDNGTGIATEEFCEEGGLGKLYCKQKVMNTTPTVAKTLLIQPRQDITSPLSTMVLMASSLPP